MLIHLPSDDEQIKQRLRFSTLSVKEISEQLNFPNQSFFCQFVRKRLGMSPMTYRKSSGALPD
ncbi:MAG: helix-turn-helix domain-containing protein [Bacteroidaceae bacterium]